MVLKKLNRLAKPNKKCLVTSPSGEKTIQVLNAWQIRNFEKAGWKVRTK